MRSLFLVLFGWLFILSAQAHEVRPAFLEATEVTEGRFSVVWKEPVISGRTLALSPVFPGICAEGKRAINLVGTSQVSQFVLECSLRSGRIEIEGLEFTLTDVFVRVTYLDGSETSSLLRPAQAGLDLGTGETLSVLTYFPIGVDHIWFGPDHLLFVFGLVLLVPYRRLIGVITAFTVAHSLTLGAAALGVVSVPGRPVEILIAMSIALLAIEVIQKLKGGAPSLALRYPWAISFAIGLIHGLGFAGALADIGLPKGDEIWSLALFNIGVEAGQVAFVGALLVLFWGLDKLVKNRLELLTRIGAYTIGSIGIFWTLERVFTY